MSEAKTILKLNIMKYDKSTLFIYFQGRLERIEVNQFRFIFLIRKYLFI
jgi:hypothetical protein